MVKKFILTLDHTGQLVYPLDGQKHTCTYFCVCNLKSSRQITDEELTLCKNMAANCGIYPTATKNWYAYACYLEMRVANSVCMIKIGPWDLC